MTQTPYNRPLPLAQPESDYYWEKTKAHELWLMHCDACNSTYFYPRPICPQCFSRNTRWMKSSGRGTVYTFAIVHRGPTPAFRDHVPYVAALVELEGGVRLPTVLIDVEPDPAKIKVGMPVEVVFDDVTDAVTLPKFRPQAG